MSFSDVEVSAATAAMDKYRGGETGEAGAAPVVVGLSAARATKESDAVTAIVTSNPGLVGQAGIEPATEGL